MKHFTLLLSATLLAMSASASVMPKKAMAVNHPNMPEQLSAKKAHKNALEGINARQLDMKSLKQSIANPASRGVGDEILETEGRTVMYEVNSVGFSEFFGYVFFEPAYGVRKVVWADNDDVYFYDLLNLGIPTYIKGHYADGEITVNFPQTVLSGYDPEEGGYELAVNVLQLYADEEGATFVNSSPAIDKVVYKVGDDGRLSLQLDPEYVYDAEDPDVPNFIIGLVADTTPGVGAWYGFGDAIQEFSVFDKVSVDLPADAQPETWVMTAYDAYAEEFTRFIQVAICGDEIYVGGLSADYEDGWAKGKINGDRVYFETDQYEGYDETFGWPVFFQTASAYVAYDEDWEEYYMAFQPTEGIEMLYDVENKTISAIEEMSTMLITTNPHTMETQAVCIEPSLKWQDPALCNGNPLNPECLYYVPWDPDYYGGQGCIIWNIPNVNVNGAILDTDRMYYSMYVDGELYPIDPEEYPFVEEYMEYIPYNYQDGEDFWVAGQEHDIYFYFDGAESFGMQSFYIGDEDVVYASEIVTYVPEVDSVNDVTKYVEVKETKYYDISGREVANPSSGLYIKSMKLADGKTVNVKVMMK